MHPLRQHRGVHIRFRAAAYLVLFIALVPAMLVYVRVKNNVRSRDMARFEAIRDRAREAVHDHVQRLIADVRAVSGFVEANTATTRREWDAFVEIIDFRQRHPGVRSIGFAEKVSAAEAGSFVERMQAQFGPDYRIIPSPSVPLMFPAVHLCQFPTNLDIRLGWDSYADTPRRAAIDSVLTTRLPAASSKITYSNGDGRTAGGFAVFVPVHGNEGEVRGVVFSSFIPQRLFNTVSNRHFSSTVSLELFDGAAPQTNALLARFGVPDRTRKPSFTEDIPINVLDRTFLLRVSTLPAFDELSDAYVPRLVLAGGLGLSLLLFGIAWRQAKARSAAEALNRRLRESEEQLRTANEELQKRIDEARLSENMLAYERDLLGMLLEHSPDSIYFKDRESRFLRCGKAVVHRLGVKSENEVVGKTDADFFTAGHSGSTFNLEREIIHSGKPVTGIVEREIRRDGQESWVLTSKMPLRDKHGHIIGTFGISKDISELKAVDLALEKEKELLAVTLRSIGDGVITTDIDGRIVLFNQVAEQVTGWTQADAAGKPLDEIFRTVAPDLEKACAEASQDAVLLTRGGSQKTISRSIAPIIDHHKNKIGAVLVFRDITEKLKTDAELLKANKLESIGVLAGGIAHDFNNILTVILGNISLARMGDSVGRPIADALEEAEKASLRARELTHRLLTFAKGGSPIRKPLDLATLVHNGATRALQGSGINASFFVADGLWPVYADESQVGQVVQNLIGYACASMSTDRRLDIHVQNQEVANDGLLLLKPGKYVRVSLRDYGAGIQAEHLTKIFEPYFGVKKHGSGLELATAYSIVRKHEGQLRVESIAGQGTVFHIYLPAVLDAVTASSGTAQRSLFSQSGPRRILVMDDELPIRKLATLLLQRIGHTATTVADGAEAIQVYEAARQRGEPFHAVIMDLTIPQGMGGKETIRQLKQLDPTVRAIVSSGYSNDPVMAEFRDYGFSGVVPKPYNTNDLAEALDELFAGRQGLQTDPADVGA